MARSRNNGNDSDNNARIKVVYFEAENVSSDLTGMIHALTGAIRTAPIQVVPNQSSAAQIEGRKTTASGNGQTTMSLDDNEDNSVESVVNTPAPEKPARERKPFKGKVLDDLNWDGNGSPFVEFVKHKNPPDTTKRYLVIATWFKRHAGYDAINSNLIYNAYLKMRWGYPADISQPFRDASKSDRGYFRGDGKGNYTITNIGLDVADKIGGEKSESEA